ncbi:MAG: GntR family transcriptional regulator [Desulfobacterales bacterium]|nr:GntR family transcriptional regulator [Desulfobacterales bacterium]
MTTDTTAAGKRRSAGDHTRRAYDGIRNLMLHNELPPGQKFSYRDLAERLGMSPTPIIQALKWLEYQQLVRHEPHRGYFTAPIDRQEVQEVYETRELIECALLGAALKRIDPKELLVLKRALAAHLKASRARYLAERLIKDRDFHLTLAALSGNRIQTRILADLFDLLYLKYSGSILFTTSMESADTDHRELYGSIAAGDLGTARRTLSRHIRRVKRHVLDGLTRMSAAKGKAGL